MKKLTLLLGIALLSAQAAFANVSPDQALKELQAGNDRYIIGKSAHQRFDPQKRRELALNGQEPIATVLGCSDARVSPEIVFDQGFGQLFIVRVAGNVCGIPELASIEYGVAALHAPLIVVLGHTKCGAVQAAVDKKPLPGSLPELMSMIHPAVAKAEGMKDHDDLVLRATKQNVFHSMEQIVSLSSIVKSAVDQKKVKLVGAIRDITDGHVIWLGELPK